MTSYPAVNEEEQLQKQDVLYRDNGGVIMKKNMLQRNVDSGDQRNGTSSSFLSWLPAHARVARHSKPCVREVRCFVSCDDGTFNGTAAHYCRSASFGCNREKKTRCDPQKITCSIRGQLKTYVIGCGRS